MKNYKHSYAKLAKIAQRYYGDDGFCAVIALAVGCDISFGKAFHALKREGRRTGDGTYRYQQNHALRCFGKRLQHDSVTGGTKTEDCRTLGTVAKRCKDWEGTYYIYVRGHVACVRDGILEDWSASVTKGSRYRVLDVYKLVEA